jgi:hypothetical protein
MKAPKGQEQRKDVQGLVGTVLTFFANRTSGVFQIPHRGRYQCPVRDTVKHRLHRLSNQLLSVTCYDRSIVLITQFIRIKDKLL